MIVKRLLKAAQAFVREPSAEIQKLREKAEIARLEADIRESENRGRDSYVSSDTYSRPYNGITFRSELMA